MINSKDMSGKQKGNKFILGGDGWEAWHGLQYDRYECG